MGEPSLSNLKRRAAKVGLRFMKSNWRRDSIDNLGGYRVISVDNNLVVDGARFDLELTAVRDVIEFWEEDEASEPQEANGPAEVAASPSHGPNTPTRRTL